MTDRIGDESVGEIACRGRVYTGPGGFDRAGLGEVVSELSCIQLFQYSSRRKNTQSGREMSRILVIRPKFPLDGFMTQYSTAIRKTNACKITTLGNPTSNLPTNIMPQNSN